MSWYSWRDEDDPEELSAFESAQLRAMQDIVQQYEQANRNYHDLLYWLATRIASGEVEQRLTKDPFAFARMKPDGWRKFFQAALKDVHLSRWLAPAAPGAQKLQQENDRLRQQLAAAEARLAELKAERDRLQQSVINLRRGESPAEAHPVPTEPEQPETEEETFQIPDTYPKRYATLFTPQETKWRREVAFIAILAGLGYNAESSLRWEIVRYVQRTPAAQRQNQPVLSNPESGSVKRLIITLEERNLIERMPINVGQSRIIILRLTELGRNVAEAMGVPIVESEWERLMRLHGGERQQKHAALTCLFTAYARRRGWRTEVCPEVKPPADPDALIEKDGERIYVEVEAESGTPERRMKKWRNQRNLQGFVAICAPNEKIRRRLVREAKANTKRGMATDLIWLRGEPTEENKILWAETWP